MSRNKLIIIAVAIPLAIAGVFAATVYFSYSTTPCSSQTSGPWQDFVIVANRTAGYNNSRNQPFVMNVQQGDCVSVTFINMDPVEPHGLAIYFYQTGVVALGNHTVSFKFQATVTGTFNVGEQIPSAISQWTDHAGSLNVQVGRLPRPQFPVGLG